jgi:short-subunit dehydrogenase
MKTFRHIVITGASSGIGEALALGYAASGVVLGLTGRDGERLAKVADACRSKGATVRADVVDVTNLSAMARWLTDFDDAHPVDLLIANAGISLSQNNPALEEFDAVRRTMASNFDGVLNTVEPLASRMSTRRQGQIGLLSSLAGFVGRPYSASYNASKAAVRLWGESIRFPLEKDNVGVSVICPGYVTSRMTDTLTGSKPLIMTTARASRIIQHGLAHNRARIAFPLGLTAGVWFTLLLPAAWAARLLRG